MRAKGILFFVLAFTMAGLVFLRGSVPQKALGQAAQPKAEHGAYFISDVMPVIDKLGCNLSECHGSLKGKGGLKLSMFGAEPADDYEAITKAAQGRRINKVEPAKSLLLLKATGRRET